MELDNKINSYNKYNVCAQPHPSNELSQNLKRGVNFSVDGFTFYVIGRSEKVIICLGDFYCRLSLDQPTLYDDLSKLGCCVVALTNINCDPSNNPKAEGGVNSPILYIDADEEQRIEKFIMEQLVLLLRLLGKTEFIIAGWHLASRIVLKLCSNKIFRFGIHLHPFVPQDTFQNKALCELAVDVFQPQLLFLDRNSIGYMKSGCSFIELLAQSPRNKAACHQLETYYNDFLQNGDNRSQLEKKAYRKALHLINIFIKVHI